MQKSLFIALCMAITTSLFGQSKPDKSEILGNSRSDTYYYKNTTYDSIRFTIQGQNDTVLTDEFYRNGSYQYRTWKKDSAYSYESQGLIRSKSYHLTSHRQADSLIRFYSDGGMASMSNGSIYGSHESIDFNKNGQITYQEKASRVGRDAIYTIEKDSLNRVYYASFLDTVSVGSVRIYWHYDTLFYKNGQPYLIQIENKKDGFIKRDFFNEKGVLIESIAPDSLRLIEFKDNVDCYYGLKTRKGDTIYKPTFDRIEHLQDNLIAVFEGKKCRLMRANGTFLATPDMEYVKELYNSDKEDNWKQWEKGTKLIRFSPFKQYLRFTIGDKYGVIDRNGQLIVPPQYREISGNPASTDSLFGYTVYAKNSTHDVIEEGYINVKGERILPNFIHTKIIELNRYYLVSNSLESFKYSAENVFGLANNKGELILPCAFKSISPINSTDLFTVHLENGDEYPKPRGIFDVKKRRWLVDTSGIFSIKYIAPNASYIIIYAEKKKKYGIIDANGKTLLPTIYEDLTPSTTDDALLIARKNKKYFFLNLYDKRKRPTYDYLMNVPFEYTFNNNSDKVIMPLFLAERNGKSGVIDSNDRILRPFTADYAAYDRNDYSQKLIFVENNEVTYLDNHSFPNKADITHLFRDEYWSKNAKLKSYNLVGESKLFFFNADGQVVIPPQYNQVSEGDDWYNLTSTYVQGSCMLIENEQKKRKFVFLDANKPIDFPFDYTVKLALPNCKIMIVVDKEPTERRSVWTKNIGVVSTDGRLLTPCINSGVVLADPEIGSYFVKCDTPTSFKDFIYGYRGLDSLSIADKDWLWYNVNGQLIDTTPFRFPIAFNNGIGVGMKNELFGIFRPDGSVVAPPQYKNIRRDEVTGFYYLFENQGLTTTVSLKKQDGQTFVERGRYEAISSFFGKYAIVRFEGKMGLIDSFGKEIIAPQDARTLNKSNLIDSINLFNLDILRQKKLLNQEIYNEYSSIRQRTMPIEFNYNAKEVKISKHPDSLKLSESLRNTLYHLVLEKVQTDALFHIQDIKIERNPHHVATYYVEPRSCTPDPTDDERRSFETRFAFVNDKTLSFVLRKSYTYSVAPSFYNFYNTNGNWHELKTNDLLMIQGEKRWTFNDLLIQKVKALKDQEIDCSNTSAFVGQVENQFMFSKEGLQFYFLSAKNRYDLVPVSFSWAELAPYLKMRF